MHALTGIYNWPWSTVEILCICPGQVPLKYNDHWDNLLGLQRGPLMTVCCEEEEKTHYDVSHVSSELALYFKSRLLFQRRVKRAAVLGLRWKAPYQQLGGHHEAGERLMLAQPCHRCTCSDVCWQSLIQSTARPARTGHYFVLATRSKG